MDTLTSVEVFLLVAHEASFARAAEKMDLSRAVVSKHVKHLEARIGTRLLDRTTRSVRLTALGEAFMRRAQQSLDALDEAMAQAGEGTATSKGRIRVTCALSFGLRHLSRLMSDFAARYPQVHVDLELSDRVIDLVEEGFDVAIRIGVVDSPALIVRKLTTTPLVLCAAPDYLARQGSPQLPIDLGVHNCLTYSYNKPPDRWTLSRQGEVQVVRVSGCVQANNGDLLLQMAIDGHGIALLPAFLVEAAIFAERLVVVLPDCDAGSLTVQAVYADRRFMPAAVRMFLEYLAEQFDDAARPLAAGRLQSRPLKGASSESIG